MARTQMRLDAVTGSIVDIKNAAGAKAPVADKNLADLQGLLQEFAGAVYRIHGEADFTNQDAGKFVHATSQFIGHLSASQDILGGQDMFLARDANVKGKLNVGSTAFVKSHITGSGELVLNQMSGSKISVPNGMLKADVRGSVEFDLSNMASEAVSFKFGGSEKVGFDKLGNTAIKGTLDVDGQATLAGATVEDLSATDGALVFHNASRKLQDNANLKYDGSDLMVPGLKDSSLTATRVVFAGANGELKDAAGLVWDGSDIVAASAKVSDLTDGRVVYAGASGALVDSAEMTFGAGGLTLTKDLSARSGSYSGDLTVQGNLLVQGDTVTVNVGELTIEDKDIVIAKVASPTNDTANEAGIIIKGATDKYIRWEKADAAFHMSDALKVAGLVSGSALYSDVKAAHYLVSDANGQVIAGTVAEFGADVFAQLNEGTGVHLSEAAGEITIAIGQAVETTSQVTFAAVTGSNLTASRLMASNGSKAMVSADLSAWVAGTANQISVADDADGSITLSLPQSIHTDADVEFDSLKLGDNVADAGKALKIGAAGEVIAAAWDEFVAIEADVGLELVKNGFKAEIGLAQDIRSTASPSFVGMTFSGLSSAPLQVSSTGVLEEMDLSSWISGTEHEVEVAQGGTDNHGLVISLPYAISDASNTALVGFTATSILGALNELAAGSGGGKGKWAEMLNADAAGGVHTFASGPDWSAAGFDKARVDIYLNGQMMKETADYALSSARTVTFTFPLKADDVVTARIC